MIRYDTFTLTCQANKRTLITYASSYNSVRRHDSVPTATIVGFTTVQNYISKIT